MLERGRPWAVPGSVARGPQLPRAVHVTVLGWLAAIAALTLTAVGILAICVVVCVLEGRSFGWRQSRRSGEGPA